MDRVNHWSLCLFECEEGYGRFMNNEHYTDEDQRQNINIRETKISDNIYHVRHRVIGVTKE